MKKKLLAMLFSGAIAFGVFAVPGNVVNAEETCACHPVTVYGAEANIEIAKVLSSDAFKTAKADLFVKGYSWNGVANVEVVKWEDYFFKVGVKVPFVNSNGNVEYATFVDGKLAGVYPSM
ncbi:hypothetical protein AM500_14505 [Bacillus sp. FJAT-18017]|uniref:hypothetical protein n=1 Tax=Bacillus sp. FJAT-18017 TaxID=1705566 RepID=UPI0006B01C3B|nr:hypothetical protein [Bacillus sp. FJAT-18017]ALC90862.1 hypothetical protein AM500_14505 [Bacillus sp. FJAT-18017]